MTYRLISKERDYYDAMFHVYGFDPKKIWKRTTDEIILRTRDAINIPDVHKKMLNSRYIGVAGKFYEFTEKLNPTYDEIHKTGGHHMYYGVNHESIKIEDYFTVGRHDAWHSSYGLTNIKKRIAEFEPIENDSLFIEYGSPVLLVENWHRSNIRIVTNPSLQYYNFSVVMDAFETWQAIEQYLESVLLAPTEPSQTSNDDRIVSAGFDMIQSFRHRKNQ